jgi:prepilin signal peptidase PulO-like enzyme (type II secretory pathway)
MIIPDEFVIALLGLATLRMLWQVVPAGEWVSVMWHVIAALAGSLFFFGLWKFSQGRWLGFGDVKLVFPLGLLVGASGVFSMIVLSFWIGAAISLFLLGVQKFQRGGQPRLRFLGTELTMTSAVPFAPFLIAGCLAVLLFDLNVLSLFSYGS